MTPWTNARANVPKRSLTLLETEIMFVCATNTVGELNVANLRPKMTWEN